MNLFQDEISLSMVFALLVFTSLLFVTICLIASDPGPASTAASVVWEVLAGNCRLQCRRPRTEVKGPLEQKLSGFIPATGQTSHTFKQAVEITHEYIDLHSHEHSPEHSPEHSLEHGPEHRPEHNLEQGPENSPEHSPGTDNAILASGSDTKITASPSTPNPTLEAVAPNNQKQSENFCTCETCACSLIENLFSKTKPAENMYNDFREAVLDSQYFQMLGNMYTRLVNSYPNTIEYLGEDTIDSEENFYFLKTAEGLSHKASAVSKHVEISKYHPNKGPPQAINLSATSSASNLKNLLTQPSPLSHSKTPSIANLPPVIKPILHHEKAVETHASAALTIREEPPTPTPQESSDFVSTREPQSIASIEREIKEFINNGPPERPPLYTCPSCMSRGLVCVRGCPKESLVKKMDKSKQQ
ncbi:unnamed protein product [Arctia plantaginis]|uniref:Uncharacterized protein n=1 Tax=Arctia plantaginis TaxID=874455 RepID=A0A8S0ZP03_ARCPL|nr:unnamed protein product [Arctia plantaginis]